MMGNESCEACGKNEICEACGKSDDVMHYDVEGVAICDVCWNDLTLWEY